MVNKTGDKNFVIECENFFSILEKNSDIDWFKLDIEGWEYLIVKQFNDQNFNFKKWQIEFHNFDANRMYEIIPFIRLLQRLWYFVDRIDTFWKIISFEEIRTLNYKVFTLYFYGFREGNEML